MSVTIPVFFKWLSVEPDNRQYKPSKPVLEPVEMVIQIDVPLEHTYVANSEEILTNQLMADRCPQPILTVAGMAYCEEQLLARHKEAPSPDETWDFDDDDNDDDDDDEA